MLENPGEGRYTCNFGFIQEVYNSDYLPGTDTAFKKELESTGGCTGATCTEEECNIIEVSTSPSCSDSDPCYVTAGSNSIVPVEVDVNRISPSNALVPSWINGGTQGETGIEYQTGNYMLNNIADDPNYGTNNPGYNNVFHNFPNGTNSGGATDPSDSGQIRNPLTVCQEVTEDCQS